MIKRLKHIMEVVWKMGLLEKALEIKRLNKEFEENQKQYYE
jgi:hypothetical protein